jgi:hypothetical protein
MANKFALQALKFQDVGICIKFLGGSSPGWSNQCFIVG